MPAYIKKQQEQQQQQTSSVMKWYKSSFSGISSYTEQFPPAKGERREWNQDAAEDNGRQLVRFPGASISLRGFASVQEPAQSAR